MPVLNKLYTAYIRYFILRGRCGKNCLFHFPVYIYAPTNLKVGHNVKIGPFCTLLCQGGISLGDNVLIASNTTISSVGHELKPEKRTLNTFETVNINKNVWIGVGSIILQGVTIGANSVVGAGSLVTKSIPTSIV